MSVDNAVDAILRLNPHPNCYARARWIEAEGRFVFPMVKAPLTREIAEKHIRGQLMIGAVASDEAGYTDSVGLDVDAHLSHQKPAAATRRFAQVADAVGVPVVVHSSKSGKGAHVRTLFKERVPTHLARALYISLVIASGLSGDAAVDKVWPPTHGLGVLAMPYNGRMAMENGGCLALDSWTLMPLGKDDQIAVILDGEEMDRNELESGLVAIGVQTDGEAQLLSGCGDKTPWTPRGVKDEQDGGVQLMYQNCAAVDRLVSEATSISYEFWFGMMTNFRPFRGGQEIFDQISMLDAARYHARRNANMWSKIAGGPKKCENLDLGWECPKRAECVAKSPAGLPFHIQKALDEAAKSSDHESEPPGESADQQA